MIRQRQRGDLLGAHHGAAASRDPLRHRCIEGLALVDLGGGSCGVLRRRDEGFAYRLGQRPQHFGDFFPTPARNRARERRGRRRAQQRRRQHDRGAVVCGAGLELVVNRQRVACEREHVGVRLRRRFARLAAHQILQRHPESLLQRIAVRRDARRRRSGRRAPRPCCAGACPALRSNARAAAVAPDRNRTAPARRPGCPAAALWLPDSPPAGAAGGCVRENRRASACVPPPGPRARRSPAPPAAPPSHSSRGGARSASTRTETSIRTRRRSRARAPSAARCSFGERDASRRIRSTAARRPPPCARTGGRSPRSAPRRSISAASSRAACPVR